jgi:hypothetical protein
MQIERNKVISAIFLTLMLTSAVLVIQSPFTNALTPVSLSTQFYPAIGVNSATLISYLPSPNVLLTAPYLGSKSVWANANVTFTRPDGSTDVLKGPFTASTPIENAGNLFPEIKVVYTPNMMGNWTVKFSWSGDGTYAAVTKTDNFIVGPTLAKRDAWAMLSLRPYPSIGVGQSLLVNAWVTPQPMSNHDYYDGYVFTFTKPDGTQLVVGPMASESPGTVWFDLPVDMIGNWTVRFDFPGDIITNPDSVTRTFMVQKEPIPYPIADTPLPTQAWAFPISVFNREWRNIAGPWMQNYYDASEGSCNPYTEAPKSAHILWYLNSTSGLGGYVGQPYSSTVMTTGIYSVGGIRITTILAGRGYYTSGGLIHCVDMSTGKELWAVAGSFNVGATRLTSSVLGSSNTAALYQFGSRFVIYDAITGAVSLNVTGLSMNFFDDPYVYSGSVGGRLIKWDTSGASTDFNTRIVWNISYPFQQIATSNALIQSGYLIVRDFPAGAVAGGGTGNALSFNLSAIDLETGKIAYQTPLMNLYDPDTWNYREGPAIGSSDGVVFYAALPHENQGRGWEGYDAKTGQKLWTSEQTEYPWGTFWAYMPLGGGYGMAYGLSYAGVYAFNLTDGKIVWHYTAGNSGMETPYNTWVFGTTGPVLGGGIIFAPNSEHTPQLYYRGMQLHAIDAFTGEKVWSILGAYSPSAVVYGTLLAQENTQGIEYAFSKGSTSTTIAVQNDVITKGSSTLVKGTVLDQSPAQPGTAAISDESMSSWMEYLHMQQPMPTNATGVKVSLDATDPNGNFVHIGTTTSGTDGQYSFLWTPEHEGKYTIIASFEGSESYYASYAQTSIGIAAAPTSSSAPTSTATPTSTPTATTATPTATVSPSPVPNTGAGLGSEVYIAIAAVVVIAIVAAAALVLRKRK